MFSSCNLLYHNYFQWAIQQGSRFYFCLFVFVKSQTVGQTAEVHILHMKMNLVTRFSQHLSVLTYCKVWLAYPIFYDKPSSSGTELPFPRGSACIIPIIQPFGWLEPLLFFSPFALLQYLVPLSPVSLPPPSAYLTQGHAHSPRRHYLGLYSPCYL